MAQKKLTQLPKTQFSGLDFSNILEDVYNMIRENPKYNENWDDFLAGNAGVMLTEIYAWITDQLATRIDWVVNENFIGTATQRSSVINLLKLIGYKFLLPVSSEVPVSISFSAPTGNYYLTETYSPSVGIFNPKTITANDKQGNTKFFEAIQYDSLSNEYGYHLPVMIDTTASLHHDISFYEGQTRIENFISNSNQGQVFSLSENPVIRHSTKVYLVEIDGGTGDVIEFELLEVDNFLSLYAQEQYNDDGSENAIPYVLNVLENDTVEVTFGTSSLLPAAERRLPEGSSIRIFYRVGGGLDGDISRGAINLKEDVTNNSVDASVKYKNNSEGIGGEDSETIEHAAYAGPLQIKTVGKTVTEEDYDIVISSFVNVLLSKSYGHNNLPSNFYEKYGYYPSPIEVLNFIVLKKSGWEDIPTNKYRYTNWGTLNLENYFNEKITFTDGEFGDALTLNDGTNELTLNELIDFDGGGGDYFNNFFILSTPQKWKDNIFIEDPNNSLNFIANPDAKASITETEYDETTHVKLEDIPNHFVANTGEVDPYFYGDYEMSGAPRQKIEEDINAYFQSERNNASGVFIGSNPANHATNPNLLYIDVDGHGPVSIDLSIGGINGSIVPLDGTNGVIEIINNSLSNSYNGVYAYQDFGILIEDTSAVIDSLNNQDQEIYLLNINGIDYDVNTGNDQTYDLMLAQMNTTFQAYGSSGYQDFFDNGASDWTVVDTTQYDFNINISTTGMVSVTLDAVSGTALSSATLIILLNKVFRENGIPANATLDGTAIRVSTNITGSTTTIDITAGTTNDLLTVTGAMQTAVTGTGDAGGNLEATFVQSSANIACHDVRISRTNFSGSVTLADSGSVKDILAAYGALPITTNPVIYGAYDVIATIFSRGSGRYIKMVSPNSGPNASITFMEPLIGGRDATEAAFGLDFSEYGETTLVNFGQKRLTIITEDPGDESFGNFIYENGSLILNLEDLAEVYLNFTNSKEDTIRLGNYYTETFSESDPEWKSPALRLYNTSYYQPDSIATPLLEEIDYDTSEFLLEFTRDETRENSIYVINSDIVIEETSEPTITSIDLSTFPSTTGKFMKIAINDNIFQKVDLTAATTIDLLVTLLNATWQTEALEKSYNDSLFFAVRSDNGTGDEIILTIGDKTRTGKIVIYDDEPDLLGATIFNTTSAENTNILPDGDFYLKLFRPQYDSVPPLTQQEKDDLTPEEKFGYFTMNINKEADNNVPDLLFNYHMVNDRRHKFLDEEIYRLRTDEDDLSDVLYPYKIVGIKNDFKIPLFSTFDIQAEVFVEKKVSTERIKHEVEAKIRDFYSISRAELNIDVNKSEIIGLALKIEGVRYMNISYFGHDLGNRSGYGLNQDIKILVDFDEVCVVSDNLYDTSGSQAHGLVIKYTSL